jgi:hypothetical protein
MAIQERENDLILATMGRGFYVLDNYSSLRELNDSTLEKEAHIFKVKDGLAFIEASPLGYGSVGFQGASYYSGSNPKTGVNFDVYVKETPKTIKAKRKENEKELKKSDQAIPYPSAEKLRAEDREEKPYLIYAISDANGNEIARFTKSYSKGINRINWDGRLTSNARVSTGGKPMTNHGTAQLALPGKYSISIFSSVDGKTATLIKDQAFVLNWLEDHTLMAANREALNDFQSQIEASKRQLIAVSNYKSQLKKQIEELKANTRNTPGADLKLLDKLRGLEYNIYELEQNLNGDASLSKRNTDTPPSLINRINSAMWNSFYSTSEPTGEQRKNLKIVNEEMEALIFELNSITLETKEINQTLIQAGAPYLNTELPELK